MANIIHFKAIARPSALMKRMMKHKTDVSEGTRYKLIAKRQLLNWVIRFYSNGLRIMDGVDLSEQEQYDSEIFRLAHASVLINEPVGDKKICYVDATKFNIEVWIYGMPLNEFIKKSKLAVELGRINVDQLLCEPVRKTTEIKDERNVRLFGR